ncbi:MAG: hypothetical protein LBP88_07315 [Treponema sp.]|nr:hypothetical protein [Treponema sp.]
MGGDRENCTNFFEVDLETGEITQLTDHDSQDEIDTDCVCINHAANKASYWSGERYRGR